MRLYVFPLFFLTMIFSCVSFSQEEYQGTSSGTKSYLDGVEVEKYPDIDIKKSCDCNYTYFAGYGKRRSSWGYTLSFAYSAYEPIYYQPDFALEGNFETIYESPQIPHIEISFGIKKNMAIGSLGIELAGGFYRNTTGPVGPPDQVGPPGPGGAPGPGGPLGPDMSLNLIPVRAGLTFAFDKLFSEPLFVPYASGGGYSVLYQEKHLAQSVKGITNFGLYGIAGLLLQLDWLDPNTAVESFVENGVVASYAFAEVRYLAFADEAADFSAPLQWAAGMRIEF